MQLAISVATLSCCSPTVEDNQKEASPYANEVIENIMTRRSIRQYEARPVNRDTMDIILECGINAPSARNCQPWEIRVVDNPCEIAKITRIYKMYHPELAQAEGFVNMFRNAPTVVIIGTCKDHKRDLDCGILAQNITLSAWSMGIGSCMLGSSARFLCNTPEASCFVKKLGLPDCYEPVLCIGLGYPTEKPEAKPRSKCKIKYIN